MKRFSNILCVVDSEGDVEPLLERAAKLAERNRARLRVVAVTERVSIGMGMPHGGPISAQLQDSLVRDSLQRLEAAAAKIRRRVAAEIDVLVGTTFLEIIHEVLRHDHDLVIKAAEDPEWLQRLFGSDDMHLLRKCPCPVWLLRPNAPSRFDNILVAVDLDEACAPDELEARRALNALVLHLGASQALLDDAELHVAHAWDPVGSRPLRERLLRALETPPETYRAQVLAQRENAMDRLLDGLPREARESRSSVHTHLVEGHPREAVPALARAVNADLVVMGTVAKTGIPGFIVGNTAEMILTQLDRSVLAVKPPGFVSPVVLDDDAR